MTDILSPPVLVDGEAPAPAPEILESAGFSYLPTDINIDAARTALEAMTACNAMAVLNALQKEMHKVWRQAYNAQMPSMSEWYVRHPAYIVMLEVICNLSKLSILESTEEAVSACKLLAKGQPVTMSR